MNCERHWRGCAGSTGGAVAVARAALPCWRLPGLDVHQAPGGLGLGLTLVRRLAELHGGTVSVNSGGNGMGSEFVVRIPYEEATPGATRSVREASAAPGGCSLSIVIVEDNPDVAQILTLAIERAGHRVSRFEDGGSALAGIGDLKPDAVVLDTGLPGMNGFEVLAKLREDFRLRSTLFIGISGAAPTAAFRSGDAHFDHFLMKPIDIKEMLGLLGNLSHKALGKDVPEGHAPSLGVTSQASKGEPGLLLSAGEAPSSQWRAFPGQPAAQEH